MHYIYIFRKNIVNTEESFLTIVNHNRNLDFGYTFPIDSATNVIPVAAKSI